MRSRGDKLPELAFSLVLILGSPTAPHGRSFPLWPPFCRVCTPEDTVPVTWNLDKTKRPHARVSVIAVWESPHWASIPRSSVPQYTMPLRYSIPGLKVYVFSYSHFLCPVNPLS